MPVKKYFLFAFCGLILGFASALMVSKLNESRGPASLDAPLLKVWGPTGHGKLGRSMSVSINPLNGIPLDDQKEVILEGEIRIQSKFDSDIEYQWILPEGVELVSGVVSDSLSGVVANQVIKIQISILNFSTESPKTIVLQAFGLKGGARIGNASAISSFSDSVAEFPEGLQKAPDRESRIHE